MIERTSSAAPQVDGLVERGEREGGLRESDIEQLAEQLALDAVALDALRDQLADRGVAIEDDCGRAPRDAVRNGELADYTTDALAAVPERGGPLPAAHRRRGARARQAHRGGDLAAKERLINAQPAPGGLDRPALPGHGELRAPRPHPGGHARPDPRRREVRLAQGLPLLDLRDAVDPPGDPARGWTTRPHDPPAGPRRAARAQDRHAERELAAELGREPTIEEIAAAAELHARAGASRCAKLARR